MIDIVDRLRFDAVRCGEQFSRGVAGNITEAADEIARLRAALFSIQCEQLDRATDTKRSADKLRRLSMATRNRIIEILNGPAITNGDHNGNA